MIINCNRNDLARAALTVSQVIPRKPASPVMAGMRIRTVDNSLILEAFDYDTSLQYAIDYEGDTTQDQVLVPGNVFADLINNARGDQVQLKYEPEAGRMDIGLGRTRIVLPTLPLNEYPALPAVPDQEGILIKSDDLARVAGIISPFSVKDATDWTAGIALKISNQELIAIGGSRFNVCYCPIGSFTGETENRIMIITAGQLALISKQLRGDCIIQMQNGYVAFSDGEATATVREMAATLPTMPFFEEVRTKGFRCDRDELISCIRMINSVSSQVTLEWEGDDLEIAAVQAADSPEVATGIEILTDNSGMIKVATKYILPILENCQDRRINIRMARMNRTGMIEDGETTKFMFVPIRDKKKAEPTNEESTGGDGN